jgi:hypothetical protein
MGMRIEQRIWTQSSGWTEYSEEKAGLRPQLVLVFGATFTTLAEA